VFHGHLFDESALSSLEGFDTLFLRASTVMVSPW